jgi:hypothetical protein
VLLLLRVVNCLIWRSVWVIQESVVVYHTTGHHYVAVPFGILSIGTPTVGS